MKDICESTDFKVRELAEKAGLQGFKMNENQFTEIYQIACGMTDHLELDPCEYIKINYQYMLIKKDITSPIAYLKMILKEDGAKARIKMFGL